MAVTLTAAVGKNTQTGQNAPNQPDDVRKVQTLLCIAHQLVGVPLNRIAVDGVFGPETHRAIIAFQQAQLGFADGVVDPGQPTLQKLNEIAASPVVQVVQPGDTSKPNPFTTVVVANPALETPLNSGTFVPDPITVNQAAFDSCVQYINNCLFGNLPNQSEKLLADPVIEPFIRVLSLFMTGLPPQDQNSLVAQDVRSNLLIARRAVFAPFLANYSLQADIVYAVSQSTSHDRASAWPASDDDAGPGRPFMLDGVRLAHRHNHLIPGTVALHVSSTSLTALHEFGHALSSYSNGTIVDLYVDNAAALNNKRGRPIPSNFATYGETTMAADISRDSLSYPTGWQSYHCELLSPGFPAVMDNYWQASDGVPEHCHHDRITRQFLRDRLLAKLSR